MINKILFSATVVLILGTCNNPSTKNKTTQNEPSENEAIKLDSASQAFNLDTNTLKRGQTFYQCPMDLQVISDKAGLCPVCGMDLENMTKQ